MANGQRGFQQRRNAAPMGQMQQGGQMGTAGAPQLPNPNAVPPPGDVNARNRIPPGLMRFLNPGMLPDPNAVAPQGMVPGQPQLQRAAFGPGVPGGLPDPNAVAPVGLQQFPGGQLPRGQAPMVPQPGMGIGRPMPLQGNFQGVPGILPSFAGGIPVGQGQMPRNLLNIAAQRLGFLPQGFGQFGP